ncbi:conserved hypothetical protein [Methylorubrum extorquens AM1]|uniref:Uncharacterized protein n=1 Tax=Methylorubrum extorquens (strain ATCC 14718 / DSM 1338 / JCM 2805 / NCIMB 9133 / AM1) TaxID=272630 RepID=C5AXT4_METEA|nr:conserved hypothetical protein [Methylorubrum extorquens AM1]
MYLRMVAPLASSLPSLRPLLLLPRPVLSGPATRTFRPRLLSSLHKPALTLH